MSETTTELSEEQIHAMCAYVRGQKCHECPKEIDTVYGRGEQGCHAIAAETLQKAADILHRRSRAPEGMVEALKLCLRYVKITADHHGDCNYSQTDGDGECDCDYGEAVAAAEAALTAHAQPKAQEWRPIETAPKDGKSILLFADIKCFRPPHGRISVGYYSVDPAYVNDKLCGLEEGWQGVEDQCIPTNQEIFTHWMPLPPAPSASKAGLAAGTYCSRAFTTANRNPLPHSCDASATTDLSDAGTSVSAKSAEEVTRWLPS